MRLWDCVETLGSEGVWEVECDLQVLMSLRDEGVSGFGLKGLEEFWPLDETPFGIGRKWTRKRRRLITSLRLA